LRNSLTDDYTKGKINKEKFDKLVDETSLRYREVFNKKIDSLDNLPEKEKERKVIEIKKNIEDRYASRKIIDLHYNLLQKKLSKYKE